MSLKFYFLLTHTVIYPCCCPDFIKPRCFSFDFFNTKNTPWHPNISSLIFGGLYIYTDVYGTKNSEKLLTCIHQQVGTTVSCPCYPPSDVRWIRRRSDATYFGGTKIWEVEGPMKGEDAENQQSVVHNICFCFWKMMVSTKIDHCWTWPNKYKEMVLLEHSLHLSFIFFAVWKLGRALQNKPIKRFLSCEEFPVSVEEPTSLQ